MYCSSSGFSFLPAFYSCFCDVVWFMFVIYVYIYISVSILIYIQITIHRSKKVFHQGATPISLRSDRSWLQPCPSLPTSLALLEKRGLGRWRPRVETTGDYGSATWVQLFCIYDHYDSATQIKNFNTVLIFGGGFLCNQFLPPPKKKSQKKQLLCNQFSQKKTVKTWLWMILEEFRLLVSGIWISFSAPWTVKPWRAAMGLIVISWRPWNHSFGSPVFF